MIAYLIRRFVQSIAVLLIVMFVTFVLPYFETGGILAPAYVILQNHATPAAIHAFAAQNGLLKPFYERFWDYLTQLIFHGNWGYSWKNQQTVWSLMVTYIPRTIWLALISLVITVLIALPLGAYQATRRNSVFDYSATSALFILYGVPAFLLCLLIITWFSIGTFHLPTPPTTDSAWLIFTDPKAFILPVAALTLLNLAFLSRFMRSAVLDVLVQDYIRTAKAKGCSQRRVLFRHAFRNALGPIVIILGLFVPGLFGGALIVESVFNYEGIGFQTVNAATYSDIPTVLGITLLTTILTLFGNLLADVALGMINPRVRVEGRS
ncbi:MAG: ABC transporter permease [Acidimicrobiaceae bacterium]|nr:ABC transporter permease [Acidimicrobiaceae bacterium]